MSAHKLFSSLALSSFLDSRKKKLSEEIKKTESDYILNVDENEFTQLFLKKFQLDPIVLDTENIYQLDPENIEVKVSRLSRYDPFHERGPIYRNGLLFTIVIPFKGANDLWDFTPNPHRVDPLIGYVRGHEICLVIESIESDPSKNARKIKWEIERFERELNNLNQNIIAYNTQIEKIIKFTLEQRKKQILQVKNIAQSLGIPIKKRENLPDTYVISAIRKKINLGSVKPSYSSQKPEPIILKQNYETILETIQSMSFLMERNPSTFSKMSESEIRNLFLMILNTYYEGGATGETFNYDGKTDILIRHKNKNAFIAECKFWTGPDGLLKTIDQLFKYISWRDTKTAILLFNKNKNLSRVLEKIDPTTQSHPNYKGENHLKSGKLHDETIFSYIFHQSNDVNRDLILTIMIFDVPQNI